MKNKICITISGKDLDELETRFVNASKLSNLIELRVDWMEEIDMIVLEKIRSMIKEGTQVILTIRSHKEGGGYEGSESERVKLIQKALDLEFDYVDVELATLKNYMFKVSKSHVIASYHNFEITPSYSELEQIHQRMRTIGADVFKIATMSKSEEDNNTLYKLLLNKEKSEDLIVIGMGEQGSITRMIAPVLGSFITFASLDKNTTAPGQIEYDKLCELFELLKV